MISTEEQTLSQRVASFIKEKRTALGMSQKEFAVYIFNDMNQQGYICRIENGTRELTVNTLEKIMKALNCKIDILEF